MRKSSYGSCERHAARGELVRVGGLGGHHAELAGLHEVDEIIDLGVDADLLGIGLLVGVSGLVSGVGVHGGGLLVEWGVVQVVSREMYFRSMFGKRGTNPGQIGWLAYDSFKRKHYVTGLSVGLLSYKCAVALMWCNAIIDDGLLRLHHDVKLVGTGEGEGAPRSLYGAKGYVRPVTLSIKAPKARDRCRGRSIAAAGTRKVTRSDVWVG